MSQKIKIRSGQVVKLELNDESVLTIRAAWDLFKAWHEDIHGCSPGYSEFVSKLLVMSAVEVLKCSDKNMRELLNIRITQ